jgi:hypothetical protein
MLKMPIHKEAAGEHTISCTDCNGPADFLFFKKRQLQMGLGVTHLEKTGAKCNDCLKPAESSTQQ